MNQSDHGHAWPGRTSVGRINLQSNEYQRQAEATHIHSGIPGLGPTLSRANSGSFLNAHGVSEISRPGQGSGVSLAHVGYGDGQVSEEGELEDIYDSDGIELGNGIANPASEDPPGENREKSGSYSPYLSSREVSIDGEGGTRTAAGTATDLANAKVQAKEAILRLWPLNMRFQSYINEGLDKSLLKSLFLDLGLSTGEVDAPVPSANGGHQTSKSSVPVAKNVDTTVASAKDKAEERKDKIARLLAAKKPRQPENVSTPVLPKALPHGDSMATNPTPTPMQKSKILQEKLAALRKSRESALQSAAQAQKDAKGAGSNDSTADERTNTNSGGAAASESTHGSGNDTDGLVVSDNRSAPTVISRHHATQRIIPSKVERTHSNPVPSKPFDQNRRSRPFLINVSDDEDDEDDEDDDMEMDIDSPGSGNGIEPTASGALLPPDSAFLQQSKSPTSASTPQDNIASCENLMSMNRRIEEMKRRIVEAEARKRAKASLQASPSVSKAPSSPREGSEPGRDLNQPDESISALIESVRGENESRRSRSRATSARISLIEARRKEQQHMLQKLELQMARIKQQMETDQLEEERLKEAETPDRQQSEESPPEPRNSVLDEASDPTTPTSSEGSSSAERYSDGSDREPGNKSDEEDQAMEDAGYTAVEDLETREQSISSHAPQTNDADQSMNEEETQSPEEIRVIGDEEPAMQNPDAEFPDSAAEAETDRGLAEEVEDDPLAKVSRISGELTSLQLPTHEPGDTPAAPGSTFAPYETPLQYFRAYRFHPSYNELVSGGLRSLTYSNKIDVQRQVCPDELTGAICPRGHACEFQHFENMKAPGRRPDLNDKPLRPRLEH